ncbi:MAG: hypothetical protein IJP68_09905 [Selenomonadaceae bacterium]|nr:hypothetical protein [Selenomonadaceae bacterium]
MADKTSATITYVDANGGKGTKSITDISPTADSGAIKNFCVALNALSTNTISAINKVEQTTITNATTKPKLTVQVNNPVLSTFAISSSFATALIGSLPQNTTKPELIYNALFYYHSDSEDPDSEIIVEQFPNNLPIQDGDYSFFQGGYAYNTIEVQQESVYASCISTDEVIFKITVDYMFAETDMTAATTYRLTITRTAGEATFVQL